MQGFIQWVLHIKVMIHSTKSWGITLGLKSLGYMDLGMNLDLQRKSTPGHWIICIVSKQDGSGVIEEDEMKSIHSTYSTQSI